MKQIGNSIICLDRVDSTNNFIANLLDAQNVTHGTVILADEQTNGRGQRGAEWQSQGGMNLTFSFFMTHDNMTVKEQPAIVHYVAMALVKTLEVHQIKAKVKWPNDILVNEQKISGILIENQVKNNQVLSSIVGIGLNVNQMEFGDLQATSIKKEYQQFLPVKDVLYTFIEQFNKLQSLSTTEIEALYLSTLWKLNEEVEFLHNSIVRKGVILGTTAEGLLKIQTEKGVEVMHLKEVQFILGNTP